jgi:trimeric autotransporter adhesin
MELRAQKRCIFNSSGLCEAGRRFQEIARTQMKRQMLQKASVGAILLLAAASLAAYNGQQPAAKVPAGLPPIDAFITTYAGRIFPMDGARADAESIGSPISMALDPAGGYYFSTLLGQVHAIYYVSEHGILSRVIGQSWRSSSIAARAINFGAMAADHSGNLIIAGSSRLYKISRNGTITDIAGNGAQNSSGDGGLARTAEVRRVSAIAVDATDTIFFSEGDRIRKIARDGRISTVVEPTFHAIPSPGSAAAEYTKFDISSLAVDKAGNLYFAASDSWRRQIFRLSPNGNCAVIAGGRKTQVTKKEGSALDAVLFRPSNLVVDSGGNLFFKNSNDQNSIMRITPEGAIAIIAADGASPFGIGKAAPDTVRLFQPQCIAVDESRNLWIVDSGNERVWKLAPDGDMKAMAGVDRTIFLGNGGPATRAPLTPAAIAVDKTGNLFVVDDAHHRICKVSTSGIITTVAGNGKKEFSGDGGQATAAGMHPRAIALDAHGNLYVVDGDRVRKIQSNGKIETVVGKETQGSKGAIGLAVDAEGNLFISTDRHILKVSNEGTITTIDDRIQGSGAGSKPAKLTIEQALGQVLLQAPQQKRYFNSPSALATDSKGNLFVADENYVRMVSRDGKIRTIAGNGETNSAIGFGDGGAAVDAQVNPSALAIDEAGNLYIVERGHNCIRMVTPDGVITTVAGNGTDVLYDRPSAAAPLSLSTPSGITADKAGNIFIASTSLGVVGKLIIPGRN